MEDTNFLFSRIDALKKKYPGLRNYQDYHLFILLCLKYFYFSDPGVAFDPELFLQEYITDGKNDGGIDAVFNDPTSENNDVIIVQSKFYENSPLSDKDITAELIQISSTLRDLDNCKLANYSSSMVTAYRNARSSMSDDGDIKIIFFTSFSPKDRRARNKIEKFVRSNFKNYDLEFVFRQDIEDQIELVENGRKFVDYDRLFIDKPDNYLEYEDSIICNISARSLQDLSARRRNGLLGMNLRYYIRKKDVDSGIEKSIKKDPNNFWYKNNGILIVCEDFDVDGIELKLWQFSIVNGGQTTNRIGHADINTDFFLQCKVVKAIGENSTEKDDFILSIAEATNSQKKIDTADMKANTPEQLSLRERLAGQHVYYVTKRGDKVPAKQFCEPYESATMATIGKLGLAAVLQMPGSARSNPARMFQNEYYYSIYGSAVNARIYADLLKLDYYYTQFLKSEIKDKGYDETTELPMFRNGRTFQLACIVFLCKVQSGVFEYGHISCLMNSQDELKLELRKTDGLERLIHNNVDNEKELIFQIFSVIGVEVLGECFYNARYRAQGDLIPSNYLKTDISYYEDVIKRLWGQYNRNTVFKESFDTIFIAR
ncbi:MAG: AIPR family protein [Clostridium sp.]|nr:AIPR family protein [Acetatifactor muris]MCM1526218.1 AIPR family protein [Bacteroides sp.]MCM1562634.1 AIPR family protein [Clostridium sp.]